jgi:Beta-galactosidase
VETTNRMLSCAATALPSGQALGRSRCLFVILRLELDLLMRRFATLVLVSLTTVLISVDLASAEPRRTPFGFFGVVVNPELWSNSPSVIDSQVALMAKSGVESIRTNFNWSTAEPSQGVYDWSGTDEIVGAAASHGVQLLPIVEFTPRWASSHPAAAWLYYAPTHPATFAAFLTQLVGRYGPGGSFWAAHPNVPRDPIRTWQIWNEPEGTKYDWRSGPWPRTYTRLLKVSYTAIHRADRGAKVVSGALVGLNTTTLTPWAEATDLYRAGFKRYFDILAVNAYTGGVTVTQSVDRSVEIVSLVRRVMRRYRDGGKPVWDTELTWTAAAGRIPRRDYVGIEYSPRGQARRLAAFYQRIATSRIAGIQRAFWYTWSSAYAPVNVPQTFQYTGLLKWSGQPGQPFQALPLLSTYAGVAAKFEGCRKTVNARACG